jgi:hypothetical protein
LAVYQLPAPAIDNPTRFEFADEDRMKRILELLVAPLIMPGGFCSVMIEINLDKSLPEMATLLSHDRIKDRSDRQVILRLLTRITGAENYDYTGTAPYFSVSYRDMSSHEMIENRIELKAACEERGIDWKSIAQEYDALLERCGARN